MTDKITIDRTVLEQALEALFMYKPMVTGVTFQHGLEAMQALRAALEQEKSLQHASSALQAFCEVPHVTDQMSTSMSCKDKEVYHTKQPQVEQEPAAWIERWYGSGPERGWWIVCGRDHIAHLGPAEMSGEAASKIVSAHNTSPPAQRKPLTDEQIHDCFQHRHRDKATERRMITRAIEFAHGITGEQE